MPIDDTDIRGLSAADARAYALEFMTALKGLDRDLATLGEEISVWAKRVELAASKGEKGDPVVRTGRTGRKSGQDPRKTADGGCFGAVN